MKMMKKKRKKIPPSAGKKIPNNKYLSSINTYLKLPPPNLPTIIIQKSTIQRYFLGWIDFWCIVKPPSLVVELCSNTKSLFSHCDTVVYYFKYHL